MSAPMACCRRCAAPLMSTILFRGYEFYCLICGAKCGFLDPAPAPATPELEQRHDELRAEFEQLSAGMQPEGHPMTPAQASAHQAASEALARRREQ
jgi:hypothetical protein